MKTCGKLFAVLLFVVLGGCVLPDSTNDGITIFTATTDFAESQDNWVVDFADFPNGDGDSVLYELQYAYTERPANLGGGKALMLSGKNHSDDLFMFMKKKLTGLAPNTDYTVVFDIELASNAPKGSVGIGGSPAESVFLKAGAAGIEPSRVMQGNSYRLNIDKGNQSSGGGYAIVLGDIATANPPNSSEYALIHRTNSNSNYGTFIVRSNGNGEIWLFVGTDSGFEGKTTVYYTKVNVVLSATSY